MPRHVRNDLSYFTMDCNIFSKKAKLRPLLLKYKASGLAVYVHILCDVYGTGYYYKPQNYEIYLLDIAEDCGISVDKVQLIITFMADRTLGEDALLDPFSLNKNTVFTSHGIQKRYAEAMKGRKRSIAEIKGDYWILTEEEERKIDTFYKTHPSADKSEKMGDKSEKMGDKSEIYDTTEQNITEQKDEYMDSQTGGQSELDFYLDSLEKHLSDSELYEEDKSRIREIATEISKRETLKINGLETPVAKIVQAFVYLCNKPPEDVSELLNVGTKAGVKHKLLYTVSAMYNGAYGF